MAHTRWPSGPDVKQWLLSIGGTDKSVEPLECFLQDAAEAAQTHIERACGQTFITATSDTTRYYDPPSNGRSLFVEEMSSVTTVQYQPTNATAETLTANTDYILMPVNYSVLGEPITYIRFLTFAWQSPIPPALRRSILVTGKFGRGSTLPADVWMAALQQSGLFLWENHRMTLTGGVEQWKDADRSFTFGSGADSPMTQAAMSWRTSVQRVIGRYRSPRVVF